MQQHFQLLAHALLGDELRQSLGPYARLGVVLGRVGGGADEGGHRFLPNTRIAWRSSTGTGGVSPSMVSATAATA